MRAALLLIHRWLGLSVGIIFCLASFTGGLMVYHQAIDRMLGGSRLETTEGMVDLARVAQAVLESEPGAEIGRIGWPAGEYNAFRVNLRGGGSKYVDAGSGRILPDPEPSRVSRFITASHPSLWIGPFGARLTRWGTLLGLVGLLIGPWLWQSGFRRFWAGFRVRRQRGPYILNLDLHRLIGIIAFPFLAVMAVTGVLYAHGSLLQRVEGALYGWDVDEVWGNARSQPDSDPAVAPPDLDTMVRTAVSATNGAAPSALFMPAAVDDAVVVNLTGDDGAIVRVKLDRYTGEVLATKAETAGVRVNSELNIRLHVGLGNPFLRLAYFLAATAGAFLLPTGLLMWWLKRRRKHAAGDRGSAS